MFSTAVKDTSWFVPYRQEPRKKLASCDLNNCSPFCFLYIFHRLELGGWCDIIMTILVLPVLYCTYVLSVCQRKAGFWVLLRTLPWRVLRPAVRRQPQRQAQAVPTAAASAFFCNIARLEVKQMKIFGDWTPFFRGDIVVERSTAR